MFNSTIQSTHCYRKQCCNSYFILLTVTCSSALRIERIVPFSWQQWLCERATVLRIRTLRMWFVQEVFILIYFLNCYMDIYHVYLLCYRPVLFRGRKFYKRYSSLSFDLVSFLKITLTAKTFMRVVIVLKSCE